MMIKNTYMQYIIFDCQKNRETSEGCTYLVIMHRSNQSINLLSICVDC